MQETFAIMQVNEEILHVISLNDSEYNVCFIGTEW